MDAPVVNTSTMGTSSSLDHSACPVSGDVNSNLSPQGNTATPVSHVMGDNPSICAIPLPGDNNTNVSATAGSKDWNTTSMPIIKDVNPTNKNMTAAPISEGAINAPAPEDMRSPIPQDMTGMLTHQGSDAMPTFEPWRPSLMTKDKTITLTSENSKDVLKVKSSPTKGLGVSLTNNDQDLSVGSKDTSMSLTLTDQSVSVTPEDNRASLTSRDTDRNSVDSLGSGGAIYVEIGQIKPHLSAYSPQTSTGRPLDDVDGPRMFSETPHSTIISENNIPQSTKSREVEYARIQKRPKKNKETSESTLQSPDNANSIRIPEEQVIDRQEHDISVEVSNNSRNSVIIRGSSGSSMTFENYQRVPGTMIPISTCLLQTVAPGEAIQATSCNNVKNTAEKSVPVPPLRVSSKPPRPTSKLNLRDNQHRSSSRRNDPDVRIVRPVPHQTSPVLVSRSPVAMKQITNPISPVLGSRSPGVVNLGRHHQRTKSSDTNMATNSPWQGQYFHGPVARAQSFQGQTYEASMLKTPSFEGHHCDKPVSRAHSYEGHHYHDGVGVRTLSFVEANQRSPQARSVCEGVRHGSTGIYQKVGSVVRSRSSVTPRAINTHQQNMVSMTKTEQSDQKQLLVKQDSTVGFRPYGTVSRTITRTLPKTENKDTASNRQSVQSYQTSISVTSVAESVKCGMKELVRILYLPFACCRRRKAEDLPKVAHRFRHYYFNRPRTCFACKQKVLSQGSACQVCRYICHRQCENQVMTSCVPQVNHEVKHEPVKKFQYSPREPPASGSNTPGANMSSLRDMINRAQVEEDHLVLDLVYITERIISMSFPSDEHEVTYSYNLKEVMNMLRTKHDNNCLVINLSEPRQDLEKFNPKHVIDYGWPDYLAPPLERLCNICKAMDSWLSTDPRHVVVVHCKGSTSRIAVIIAAFMHYCSICASADQALDRFAMKRFYDDKLGGITLPSQIRYIEYFYGLLSGAIKINSNPLYLHHIVIHGVPNFDTQGGCRPFIKVYQGMQNIFTSGVYNVTDQMQKVCISISPGIPLRGDIMIKCYHKKAKTGQREVVWACQFHTCAISGYTLTFAKKDLDDARTDPRFPDSGKVEFVFGNSQDSNVRVTDFKSDVTVPVDDGSDALVRWDSYENFSHVKNADGTVNDVNENSVTSSSREGATRSIREQHSQGPVDGSLYATVTKRKHEHVETTSSSLFQNGTTSHDQQNGSHTSSVDSGISASSSGIAGNTSSNMNATSTSVNITPQYTTNVNNNDSLHQSFSSTLNSSKSSYNNGVSSGQKKTVPPLDEQTQLDMILSDLLNDSVFVSSPQSPPKSGANSVSKDTRTFRTYDTQSTPDGKTTYQTAEVTYKIPGGYKEERNYSMTKTEEKSYVPKNAFSYTSGPTSPELQRKAESPKTHSLPYRTDYDNRYYSNNESSFNRTMDSSRSMSPNEQTSSWLQEQQQKLRQRKDSKDEKTVQQERQLVEELKTAQNKYFMKRANNQAEEQATMETYRTASSPPPVANGPVSSSYVVTQNHTYSTDRSAHEPVRSFSPPGFTGTTQRSTTAEQKEKVERERNRLEELEKSLQAASNSIIATTPWQQQQQQQKSYSTTERHVTRRVETRKYETQQQQHHQQQSVSSYDGHREVPPLSPPPHQRSTSPEWDNMNMHGSVTVSQVQAIAPPPPKQISVVEEDKISLRPIGPGVQTLEPEGMGTMGRSGATTPSFPVSPVASAATPPFPVSPRTPYYNQAGSVTSPFNTMSSTSSQHHMTQQHQQHQQHVVHHQQPQQQQHQQQLMQQQQQQQFQQQQQQQQQQQHTQHQQYQYQQEYHTGGRHQSGSMSSQDASHALHVDTSPRMVSPGGSMARTPTSPPSPSSLNTLRQQLSVGGTMSPTSHSMTGQSSPSLYFGTSRRGSISSLAESEPAHITTPRFVKDMSKYWYKPQITREDAIMLLKDKQPGSFVVRDSNSYPGAFGLALKVAQIPANVQTKSTGDPSADLVRHFLIEPTHKGVRLRGSNNEPIFGSLASLVYQHSNTPLSLPCKLVLPDAETVAMEGSSTIDSSSRTELPSSAAALLAQGAACNVLFLNTVDTESLTGPQAVARAMKVTFDTQPSPKTTVVHFKVSNQGITLTDNQRKLFFRRHYPVAAVTYCGMDPDGRKWKRETETGALMEARVFGFVARKSGGHSDNACHLFAEVDPEQPASAIVNFVTKIMIGQSGKVKP